MTNFIPIFPLSIIVYPGESLPLHIFENRYKQLTRECYENKKPFGIPAVINDRVNDMGTTVMIEEISREYEDGEMDIKTRGIKIFRILEMVSDVPEKLYSGAIVNYPDNHKTGNRELMHALVKSIRELHRLLKVEKDFKKADDMLLTYDVAHHAGMSLLQEYELLELMNERQRQEYLKRHLTMVLPLIAEMEALKEKIKLNGHFRSPGGTGL